jgi:hypothetical protein
MAVFRFLKTILFRQIIGASESKFFFIHVTEEMKPITDVSIKIPMLGIRQNILTSHFSAYRSCLGSLKTDISWIFYVYIG